MTQIKSGIEQAKLDLEVARRAGDLARMSEIQHGLLPELEHRLLAASDEAQPELMLLRSRVTEEEVAEVVRGGPAYQWPKCSKVIARSFVHGGILHERVIGKVKQFKPSPTRSGVREQGYLIQRDLHGRSCSRPHRCW